jgi:hypothetical protein
MGVKIETVFEPSEPIVSMVEHQGKVYVATQRRVYRMNKDDLTGTERFEPMVFHQIAET